MHVARRVAFFLVPFLVLSDIATSTTSEALTCTQFATPTVIAIPTMHVNDKTYKLGRCAYNAQAFQLGWCADKFMPGNQNSTSSMKPKVGDWNSAYR